MSHFDCYVSWGFTENPFQVNALRPDERGRRLLVGREIEIEFLVRRLHKQGKITCLDGHVGVGKTSLVNVAALTSFKEYFKKTTQQLLIPCVEPFELRKDESPDAFCQRVYVQVAQTLLKYQSNVEGMGLDMANWPQVHAWLNSPVAKHIAAGFNWLGTISSSKQLNTTEGFESNGFEALVKTWLHEIFGQRGSGGVVCIIDNIELLESAVNARRTLEALRDRLFSVGGLRWAFCGANGVIHSLAASPRLTAFLNTPVHDVANIKPSFISKLFEARIQEFSLDPTKTHLPIRVEDLERLYTLINENLRDLLALADEYCEHIFSLGKDQLSNDQKEKRFNKWFDQHTTDRYNTLSSRIPTNAWAVLDTAMSDEFKGIFGLGDYSTFNSNSRTQITATSLKRHVRDLEKHGLISRLINDRDGSDGFKRDVCNVTSKGCLVHYARVKREETQTIAPSNWLTRVHHPKKN